MSFGYTTEIALRDLAEALTKFLNGEMEFVKDTDTDNNPTWRFQLHLEE